MLGINGNIHTIIEGESYFQVQCSIQGKKKKSINEELEKGKKDEGKTGI